MFILILFIAFVIFLLFILKMWLNIKFVVSVFKSGNTITDGKKGKGKDLLFSLVAKHYLKQRLSYIGNLDYTNGKNFENVKLRDFSIEPNNFKNFINDDIIKVVKTERWENKDYFLSDGGIYLPSHFDNVLSTKFESLPILYALQRHLYGSNFHINAQVYGRVWLKIREQADGYFHIVKNYKWTKIFGYIFLKVRYYDDYRPVEQNIRPFHFSLLNKFNRALYADFEAKNGLIKDMLIPIKIKDLTYDTRYFHVKIFGQKFKKVKTRDFPRLHVKKTRSKI